MDERMDEGRKGSEEAGRTLSCTGFIILLSFNLHIIVLCHALTSF